MKTTVLSSLIIVMCNSLDVHGMEHTSWKYSPHPLKIINYSKQKQKKQIKPLQKQASVASIISSEVYLSYGQLHVMPDKSVNSKR